MIYKAKYPIYGAKLRVVKKNWHGWSPEGFNIPPEESVHEKLSGSRLIISEWTHKMESMWSDEDQKVENLLRVDYLQKEGFRIYIPWKVHNNVNFSPDVTLEPISGKVFPVSHDLPLKKETLKIGESFEIKPFSLDAGVIYTVSLLEIYKSDKYIEVNYVSNPSEEINDDSVIIEQVED